MVALEAVIIHALVPVALIALVISTIQAAYLTVLVVGQSRIGRVLFLSILSLKVWVAVFLGLTLALAINPHLFTPNQIKHLNLGLLAYLVFQPIITSIALWRL